MTASCSSLLSKGSPLGNRQSIIPRGKLREVDGDSVCSRDDPKAIKMYFLHLPKIAYNVAHIALSDIDYGTASLWI